MFLVNYLYLKRITLVKNKIDSDKVNSILDKITFIIIICLIALVPITFFINYFSLFHLGSRFTFKIHQVLTFILLYHTSTPSTCCTMTVFP